jgi:hypothetical protein
MPCEISGLRRRVVEAFALLEYYAVLVGIPLLTFQDGLSVPFSRVKDSKKNAGNGQIR